MHTRLHGRDGKVELVEIFGYSPKEGGNQVLVLRQGELHIYCLSMWIDVCSLMMICGVYAEEKQMTEWWSMGIINVGLIGLIFRAVCIFKHGFYEPRVSQYPMDFVIAIKHVDG